MNNTLNINDITSWILGIILFVIGLMNLFLVHPVPGIVFILLSMLFFPPTNVLFKKHLRIAIPLVAKIVVFIVLVWFTLGVSDLGEIMGL